MPRLELPVPVICIGNLTVGGTGKTPFVHSMISVLQRLGYHPAILSRGYQAVSPPVEPFIVSDGIIVNDDLEKAGDEALLLANACPGVPVVVHADRYAAGLTAVQETGVDCVVLDDGFQHDRLKRDLDIVLWDVRDRPRAQRLLPAGRLREGLGAVRRADVLMLTHAEYIPESERESKTTCVLTELKNAAPSIPVFDVHTLPAGVAALSACAANAGSQRALPDNQPWSARRVILVSGLARPDGFEQMLRQAGAIVVDHFVYPDHVAYSSDHVREWQDRYHTLKADLVVTTWKDAIKIERLDVGGLPVRVALIRMEVGKKDRWMQFVGNHMKPRG